MGTKHSGFMIQAPGRGTRGNFEVVIPNVNGGGGLAHFWRDNDRGGLPWKFYKYFSAPDILPAASLIQVTHERSDLAVVAREGGRLLFYTHDPYVHSPGENTWRLRREIATNVTGNPALIQSNFGVYGNLEVVVPREQGGLAHYWCDTSASWFPYNSNWNGPFVFGTELGQVEAVALIQSSFNNNLEVVARVGYDLFHLYRERNVWKSTGSFFNGAAGIPGFIQSTYGTKGNFEVVTPLREGGMAHLWRNNDGGQNWTRTQPFYIGGRNRFEAVALIQSNFRDGGSDKGNLEVVARLGDHCGHFWRGSSGWVGPTATFRPPDTFQILSPQPFYAHSMYSEDRLFVGTEQGLVTRFVFNKPVNVSSVVLGDTLFLTNQATGLDVPLHPPEWSTQNRVMSVRTVEHAYQISLYDERVRFTLRSTITNSVNGSQLDADSDGVAGGADYWTEWYWLLQG